MNEPTIAGRTPIVSTLPAGTYYWCACGLATTQPMCDGSHKGKGFAPLKFELTEPEQKVALCTCKQSANKPFCDGSHSKLPA